MNKQAKQMIVLLVVLAVLVAAFFGVKQYNKVQSEKPDEETGETVVDIAEDDVVKISYDYNGTTYTFEKVDGTWYDAEDHFLPIYQYLIKNMVGQIAPLKAQQVMENVTDMSRYGLAQPERTISFETSDASYIFQVGDYNTVSSVHYLCKPSETTVYAVSATTVNVFNKDLNDLVDNTDETEAETATEAETESEIEAETEADVSTETETESAAETAAESTQAEETTAED